MNILGFSGIANGQYYREKFGLRFVGHDSSIALVVDGKAIFAVEEERLLREKHTSRFPVRTLRAALQFAGLELNDIDRIAYPWCVSPGRIAHMFTHHGLRVPLPYWPELALAGTRVICDVAATNGSLPGSRRQPVILARKRRTSTRMLLSQ